MMDTKSPVISALGIGAIVVLLGVAGVIAYRSLAPNTGVAGAAGGAKTVAPAVQRYPDGTIVPYPAAPTGATPGDPYSVNRVAKTCPCCGQPLPAGVTPAVSSSATR